MNNARYLCCDCDKRVNIPSGSSRVWMRGSYLLAFALMAVLENLL
jgi:hypothetical protein